MPRHSLSNSHFSTDYQSHEVLQWLKENAPKQYEYLNKNFEGDLDRIKFTGSHYDTDAMEVDIEWGSWLVNAIEQLDLEDVSLDADDVPYEHDDGSKGWSIFWEDGEPWLERLPRGSEIFNIILDWFAKEVPGAPEQITEPFKDHLNDRLVEFMCEFLLEHVNESPESLDDFTMMLEAGFMIGYVQGHEDGETIFS